MQNYHASGTEKYYISQKNWNNLNAHVWSPLTTSGLETEQAYTQRKSKEVHK